MCVMVIIHVICIIQNVTFTIAETGYSDIGALQALSAVTGFLQSQLR